MPKHKQTFPKQYKPALQSSSTTSKSYAYSKGSVNLSFTLRTDVTTELSEFLDVLKKATAEVEADLVARMPART